MRNKPIDQLLTGHKLTKNDGKLSLRTPVRQTTPKNGHKLVQESNGPYCSSVILFDYL